MKVFPVNVRTDQYLTALEVFCQPPCGFVGLLWIDRRAFWEALHHVIEHHAAILVVEQLRVQEIVVDALRLAIAIPAGSTAR